MVPALYPKPVLKLRKLIWLYRFGTRSNQAKPGQLYFLIWICFFFYYFLFFLFLQPERKLKVSFIKSILFNSKLSEINIWNNKFWGIILIKLLKSILISIIIYDISACIDKFCPPGTFCATLNVVQCVKEPCKPLLACLPVSVNGTEDISLYER